MVSPAILELVIQHAGGDRRRFVLPSQHVSLALWRSGILGVSIGGLAGDLRSWILRGALRKSAQTLIVSLDRHLQTSINDAGGVGADVACCSALLAIAVETWPQPERSRSIHARKNGTLRYRRFQTALISSLLLRSI